MYMCGTLIVFHTTYSWHDDDTIVDYWTCVLGHSSLGWRGEQSFIVSCIERPQASSECCRRAAHKRESSRRG